MKRYLIEPEFVPTHEPGEANGTGKLVYRIIDTHTGLTVPPEGEDVNVIARACADLNVADAKARLDGSNQGSSAYLGSTDSLPDEIVQSIAISNAESIGVQPGILANLDLAQQVFNQNMRQQNALAQQQAMNLIRLAMVAKCVSIIGSAEGNDHDAIEKMGKSARKLFDDMQDSIDRQTGAAPSAPTP